MIETINGIIFSLKPTFLVVKISGFGLGIHVPVSVSQLKKIGSSVELHTYMHVKEDELSLYGFDSEGDKELFLALISISGIGPKLALRLLSECPSSTIINLISSGDSEGLTRLKGIGKKTAELLVIHLRTKLSGISTQNTLQNQNTHEALLALISLGLKEASAIKALERAIKELGDAASSAELISEALRHT
jgi:Holliday junction DNA helicase RuvA